MQKLTNKEEEIMHILWKLDKAFVKDVLERDQRQISHIIIPSPLLSET